MGLYERFEEGETLHVTTTEGTKFYAKPEYFSGLGFLAGYTLLDESKKTIPGKYRKAMDQKDLREWLSSLAEIEG